MPLDNRKTAGLLLFVGATQFIFAAIIAEGIDTEYTFSQPMNWLGAGPAAWIYNSSLILCGLFVIISAYLIQRPFTQQPFSNKLFWFLMTMSGVGALTLGLFTEEFGLAHVVAVRIFWVFSAPAAMISYKFQKKPLSYISVILGVLTLIMIILFLSSVYVGPALFLGIGRGGMQRMIQYPIFIWILGFGAHLIGNTGNPTTTTSEA